MTSNKDILPYVAPQQDHKTGQIFYDITAPVVPQPREIFEPGSWSKAAIAAFILIFLIPFSGGLAAFPAVVLGHIGIHATRKQAARGRVFSILALVAGYAVIAAYIAIILLALNFSHSI